MKEFGERIFISYGKMRLGQTKNESGRMSKVTVFFWIPFIILKKMISQI